MAKVMYLPLAEKMLDKFVKENRMNALAELRLYIMILEMVDKPEQVLRVLEGPLGLYFLYIWILFAYIFVLSFERSFSIKTRRQCLRETYLHMLFEIFF